MYKLIGVRIIKLQFNLYNYSTFFDFCCFFFRIAVVQLLWVFLIFGGFIFVWICRILWFLWFCICMNCSSLIYLGSFGRDFAACVVILSMLVRFVGINSLVILFHNCHVFVELPLKAFCIIQWIGIN